MVKKKDEPVFVEPEFDEKEYIREEMERAKSAVVVFLIGALIGLLAGYLDMIGMWYFSILIIFVFLLFFKIILNSLGLEIPRKTTNKIFMGGELVLTWLIFWIIFLNPPVHVVAGPQISNFEMHDTSGWASISQSKGVYQLPVTNHSVRLYIHYKYPITSVSVTEALSGSSTFSHLSSNYAGSYVYFNLSGHTGTSHDVKVVVQSTKASNSVELTVNFAPANPSIEIAALPYSHSITSPA